MDAQGIPRRRRSRPVPEALPAELDAAAARIAKGWLLELIEAAPLEHAARIAAADTALEAPALCRAVVQAVASDSDMEDLSVPGSLAGSIGRLTGAETLVAELVAVDALRAVVADELTGGLGRCDVEVTTATHSRISDVCALLTFACGGSNTAGDFNITAAIARRLEGSIGAAVLLVEVDDRERLALVDSRAADAAFRELAGSVAGRARRANASVYQQEPGRIWIVIPGPAPDEASSLAREFVAMAGPAISASAGLVFYPQDGATADVLVDHAEERLFAAHADGVAVSGRPGRSD